MIARSLLFVPGDRPERFDKAAVSGAHQVVLDLEDAVAPAAKDGARAAVAGWLAGRRSTIVRINPADTPWHAADLRMAEVMPGAAIMLPKADAATTARVMAALPGREVIALLETVAGYGQLQALAALPGLSRIAFGSVDFSADSGIADEGENLTPVRTAIVLASALGGLLPPLDGVSVEFNDAVVMQAEARRARSMGFGGKLCIHPRQVGSVNQAWVPSGAEQEWAARVLAAFEASGGAATAVDGKMIDKPVVDRARRILSDMGQFEEYKV